MFKNLKTNFLIICLIICSQSHGQSLSLKMIGESKNATKLIDSIGYDTKFSTYNALETEILKLKNKLSKVGFIDSELISLEKFNDSLYTASIFTGKKINDIRVFFNSDFDPKILKPTNVKIGLNFFEFKISETEDLLQYLNSKIAEQGAPFSTLNLVELKKENEDLISAKLLINKRQKRNIDKIVLKGYDNFPESYVKHFLKLKTGKVFNLEDIKSKTQLLEELNFANQIKDPEVLFTNDSTTLYLYLKKTQSNNFDGFLGFGNNENTNKLEFDGYLNLLLNNNLNFGESLSLLYKSDKIDQQTFDIKLNMPFLFSSPIGIDLGINIFRKDSTFITTKQNLFLSYQINAQQKIAAGLNAINSSNLLDEDSPLLNDFNANYVTLNYYFRRTQLYDSLFPINFLFNVSTGIGQRKTDNFKQSQSNVSLEAYKIFNLNDKNSLFLRLTGASLVSDNYLDNELYRFGGINSIRGFEENSLVGNLFSVLNSEYRYRLSKTIYVHSVFDAAYSENDILNTKTKLFGFGFGFGLITQAGLFKLNYSSGKTENQSFKFSDSKVHISLTATF